MKSRARDTGTKLQVNEKILDSVTKLMAEIQQLVRKSKSLQEEIVSTGRVCITMSVCSIYKQTSVLVINSS